MAAHHKILGIVTILYLLLFLMHCVYFAWRKERIISVIWGYALCCLWASHGGYCFAVDRVVSVEHGTRAALELLRIPHLLRVVYYGPVDIYEKKAFTPKHNPLRVAYGPFSHGLCVYFAIC